MRTLQAPGTNAAMMHCRSDDSLCQSTIRRDGKQRRIIANFNMTSRITPMWMHVMITPLGTTRVRRNREKRWRGVGNDVRSMSTMRTGNQRIPMPGTLIAAARSEHWIGTVSNRSKKTSATNAMVDTTCTTGRGAGEAGDQRVANRSAAK